MSRTTVSSAVTVVAGGFVVLSGLLGLWQQAAPSTTVAFGVRVTLLVGVAVLVVGSRSRPGLHRPSPVAAVALLLWPVADLVSAVSLAFVRDLEQLAVLGPVLYAVQVVGLAGGLTGAVLVTRWRLLDPWAAWALVAVVGLRVVFALSSVAPVLYTPLALVVAQAYVVVPLAVVAFGVGLMMHGRAARVRARLDRAVESWRSSTDVT